MRWRGELITWGLWLPPEHDWSEFLSRHWEATSRLHPLGDGLLFGFATPQLWPTEKGPALAVVATKQGWGTFPQADPSPGEVVWRWQGETHRTLLSSLPPVDLSTLWDSSSLLYLRPQLPVKKREISISIPSNSPTDVRSILKKIPPKAPEQKALLEQKPDPGPPYPSAAQSLASFVKGISRRLSSQQPSGTDDSPGIWEKLRSLMPTPNTEKQQYLSKILRLFESEQWDQALRHAIPLLQNPTGYDSIFEHLGRLRPQTDLTYSQRSTSVSLTFLEAQGREALNQTYRQSVRSLIASNQIDYAAYILSELLDEPREAVSLLEQHERYKEAALLAELKDLSVHRQSALWYLAGETEKALELARRHDIHAQVCQHLCKGGASVIADRFRASWAEDLVRAGRLEEALTVGWPARRFLNEFEGWLRTAISSGGSTACQALAMALREPELTEQVDAASHLKSWFSDHDPATWWRRRELLHLLSQSSPKRLPPELTSWAGETARRLLRQSNGLFPLGGERELAYLVRLSEDPWLAADRPTYPQQLSNKLGVWRQNFSRLGQLPMHDAVSLGNGTFLVALGEAGLITVDSQGVVLTQFSQPAYHLITSPRSDLILIVGGTEFARFQNGRCTPWGFVEIDGFADSYQGFHWLVWRGNDIFAIDLSKPPEQSWSASAAYPVPVAPQRVLAGPISFGVETEFDTRCLSLPKGQQVFIRPIEPASEERFLLGPDKNHRLTPRDGAYCFGSGRLEVSGEFLQGSVRGKFGLLTTRDDDKLSVGIFDLSRPSLQTVLEFPQATRVHARVQGSVATVCDDRGRLVFVHLKSQQVLSELYL